MSLVTVVTGTFGDPYWDSLARSHARSSLPPTVEWIHVHLANGELHEARNKALARVRTPYVIHLDADDQLAPSYLGAMLGAVWARGLPPTPTLFAPMVRYHSTGRTTRPARFPVVAGHHFHECIDACLRQGNWLVVGTMAPAELLREVGGWRDFPWSEDWDLWIRCWQAGAEIVRVPEAVYEAWARPDSRNRGPLKAAREAAHRAIYDANFGDVELPSWEA